MEEIIKNMIYELLNELGLSVSSDNYIILQSGGPLTFNGKYIRYSYDEKFIIDGREEIWFDPINNSELIKNLYNKYTVDHYTNENIKITNTKIIRESNSHKNKIYLSYIDENDKSKGEMNTPYYNNINIGYIQIMLRNIMVVTELDNN